MAAVPGQGWLLTEGSEMGSDPSVKRTNVSCQYPPGYLCPTKAARA